MKWIITGTATIDGVPYPNAFYCGFGIWSVDRTFAKRYTDQQVSAIMFHLDPCEDYDYYPILDSVAMVNG